MTAVARACISYEHRLLLRHVSTLTVSSTWIDGVLVVEAAADGVTFDDLITHIGGSVVLQDSGNDVVVVVVVVKRVSNTKYR